MPQKNLYASPIMPNAVITRARIAKQRMAKLRAERVRDATANREIFTAYGSGYWCNRLKT